MNLNIQNRAYDEVSRFLRWTQQIQIRAGDVNVKARLFISRDEFKQIINAIGDKWVWANLRFTYRISIHAHPEVPVGLAMVPWIEEPGYDAANIASLEKGSRQFARRRSRDEGQNIEATPSSFRNSKDKENNYWHFFMVNIDLVTIPQNHELFSALQRIRFYFRDTFTQHTLDLIKLSDDQKNQRKQIRTTTELINFYRRVLTANFGAKMVEQLMTLPNLTNNGALQVISLLFLGILSKFLDRQDLTIVSTRFELTLKNVFTETTQVLVSKSLLDHAVLLGSIVVGDIYFQWIFESIFTIDTWQAKIATLLKMWKIIWQHNLIYQSFRHRGEIESLSLLDMGLVGYEGFSIEHSGFYNWVEIVRRLFTTHMIVFVLKKTLMPSMNWRGDNAFNVILSLVPVFFSEITEANLSLIQGLIWLGFLCYFPINAANIIAVAVVTFALAKMSSAFGDFAAAVGGVAVGAGRSLIHLWQGGEPEQQINNQQGAAAAPPPIVMNVVEQPLHRQIQDQVSAIFLVPKEEDLDAQYNSLQATLGQHEGFEEQVVIRRLSYPRFQALQANASYDRILRRYLGTSLYTKISTSIYSFCFVLIINSFNPDIFACHEDYPGAAKKLCHFLYRGFSDDINKSLPGQWECKELIDLLVYYYGKILKMKLKLSKDEAFKVVLHPVFQKNFKNAFALSTTTTKEDLELCYRLLRGEITFEGYFDEIGFGEEFRRLDIKLPDDLETGLILPFEVIRILFILGSLWSMIGLRNPLVFQMMQLSGRPELLGWDLMVRQFMVGVEILVVAALMGMQGTQMYYGPVPVVYINQETNLQFVAIIDQINQNEGSDFSLVQAGAPGFNLENKIQSIAIYNRENALAASWKTTGSIKENIQNIYPKIINPAKYTLKFENKEDPGEGLKIRDYVYNLYRKTDKITPFVTLEFELQPRNFPIKNKNFFGYNTLVFSHLWSDSLNPDINIKNLERILGLDKQEVDLLKNDQMYKITKTLQIITNTTFSDEGMKQNPSLRGIFKEFRDDIVLMLQGPVKTALKAEPMHKYPIMTGVISSINDMVGGATSGTIDLFKSLWENRTTDFLYSAGYSAIFGALFALGARNSREISLLMMRLFYAIYGFIRRLMMPFSERQDELLYQLRAMTAESLPKKLSLKEMGLLRGQIVETLNLYAMLDDRVNLYLLAPFLAGLATGSMDENVLIHICDICSMAGMFQTLWKLLVEFFVLQILQKRTKFIDHELSKKPLYSTTRNDFLY